MDLQSNPLVVGTTIADQAAVNPCILQVHVRDLKCSLSQGELVFHQLGPLAVATVLNLQVFLPIDKLNNFFILHFPVDN